MFSRLTLSLTCGARVHDTRARGERREPAPVPITVVLEDRFDSRMDRGRIRGRILRGVRPRPEGSRLPDSGQSFPVSERTARRCASAAHTSRLTSCLASGCAVRASERPCRRQPPNHDAYSTRADGACAAHWIRSVPHPILSRGLDEPEYAADPRWCIRLRCSAYLRLSRPTLPSAGELDHSVLSTGSKPIETTPTCRLHSSRRSSIRLPSSADYLLGAPHISYAATIATSH